MLLLVDYLRVKIQKMFMQETFIVAMVGGPLLDYSLRVPDIDGVQSDANSAANKIHTILSLATPWEVFYFPFSEYKMFPFAAAITCFAMVCILARHYSMIVD